MEFLYNIILINKICWLPHPFKGRGKYFIRQNRVFSLLQKRSRYFFPLLSNLKGRLAPSLLFSSKINKCLGEEVSSTGDSNSSGWRRKEKRRRRSDSTLESNFHLSASDAPLPPSSSFSSTMLHLTIQGGDESPSVHWRLELLCKIELIL